ncbi:DNA cytosine methyltransferase [Virgisporangium aliadipatigenens]|uniref:DNA (cytosine-5-)-methyltransferase n=1 Tax=Virgisporangium aliadipatigenens TaxID=741659 RepID=A0A8J3YV43_9ACTN|nr:DNA cytosine methyltransferase [Virgisporangium aliadipatigenens]GIJ52474.1 DNA cytosine methyltransferase [Virgisporangium aliadipatigenens]
MLTVADYFCGAGGSSTGMEQVPGVRVVMASNHWQLAVDTHHANFPHADHDREDITRIDPRRHPGTDIGWFSPECTWWTVAKGIKCDYDGRPVQLDLFAEDVDDRPLPSEAAIRSRMLMQDVPRFTEVHRYRAVIVENVTDVLKWEHLDEWLRRMALLGYRHRTVVLNSAFATAYGPGAPQLRDRVYFVFWRDAYPAPDFAKWTRPRAWCPSCGDVRGVYVDKRPGARRIMRYGAQYFYRCPRTSCRGRAVHPYALPALTAIDLTRPARRIGERSTPLSPKTLARIAAGLRRHTRPGSVGAPECAPLLVPCGGGRNTTSSPATAPMRARTTRETEALVVPLRNNGVARPAGTHPMVTFAAGGTHQALVIRNNTARGDQGQMATRLDEPLRAITTAGHQSLLSWDHLLYGYDTGHLRSLETPLPAQTTVDGDAVLGTAVDVDECTFRMLATEEIRAGMAFTPGYRLLGTSKKTNVRMLGNAVTPPAARDLTAALVEAVTGVELEPAA